MLPEHKCGVGPQLSTWLPIAAAFITKRASHEVPSAVSDGRQWGQRSLWAGHICTHSLCRPPGSHLGATGAQRPSNMQAQSIKDKAPTWPPPKMMEPVRKKISHLQTDHIWQEGLRQSSTQR